MPSPVSSSTVGVSPFHQSADSSPLVGFWDDCDMKPHSIDTGTDDLLAHVDGSVGVITFNRPERRNALSQAMYGGFARALPAFAADDDVKAIVVTGAGRAFCAGADLIGINFVLDHHAARDLPQR